MGVATVTQNSYFMKKLLFFTVVALAMTSCSYIANTSTRDNMNVIAVSPVIAELDVSKTKITYVYTPVPSSISALGKENVINTAVKEALYENGNADVFVGLETQIKYYGLKIDSVIVTGYPAKYKNFRSSREDVSIKDVLLLKNSDNH